MFSSVRVKIATTLLVAAAIAGGGVAVAGGAQAAPGRMVEGTWVNGYLATMEYETPRSFNWGYAWNQCRLSYPGTRSVKHLKTIEYSFDELTMIYACSDAARP